MTAAEVCLLIAEFIQKGYAGAVNTKGTMKIGMKKESGFNSYDERDRNGCPVNHGFFREWRGRNHSLPERP